MVRLLVAQSASPAIDVRSEQRLEFNRLPHGWLAVLAIALVAVGVWWVIRNYRRESRAGSTTAMRMFLAALRTVALLLLVGIWLEPVLASYFHQHIESYTVVLVDASASMDIEDQYLDPAGQERLSAFSAAVAADQPFEGPQQRVVLAKSLLASQQHRFLKSLARRNHVKLYSFADNAVELAALRAQRDEETSRAGADFEGGVEGLDFELSTRGQATNVGQALRQSVESVAGAPLSAVVIISDGSFNQGESIDLLGHYARAKGVALHTVGVGDAAAARNARIVDLTAPANAFVGDPFPVTVRVETQQLADEVLEVELFELRGGGKTRLAGKRLVPSGNEDSGELTFEQRSTTPGRLAYQISVAAQPGEAVTVDNSRQVQVNILDNKMRVLLVSSGPSWSYRYLARLLQRDETFDLSCWLQSADRTAVRDGNTIIDHLPATPDELFAYDAVVLLDPDPVLLTPQWAELLDRHVTRNAAGVLYGAARKHTPALFRAPQSDALLKLLPVAPDPEADLLLNQIGYYQRFGAAVEFPRAALNHALLSGSALAKLITSDTTALQQDAVQVYWHYPVKHEKPAATVLMRHAHPRMRNSFGGHVLLASHYVGAGRAAFLAFDGTWRWRRYGDTIYEQFWVRLLRHLAEGKLLGGSARGRIHTDQDAYAVGDEIRFSALLFDRYFEALKSSDVDMSLTAAGGQQSIKLQIDPKRPGWYRGQVLAEKPGRYLCEVRLDDGAGSKDIVVRHEFEVRTSTVEFLQPQMQRENLKMLSGLSAGGSYLDIEQAPQLAQRIPDRHETRTTRGTPEPLWDSGWLLGVLIVLLCVEWALRKRWQLL